MIKEKLDWREKKKTEHFTLERSFSFILSAGLYKALDRISKNICRTCLYIRCL